MEQITNLSINVLKVHPQNQEFFDDIEGEQYGKFKKSIQEDGVITPLIVSPDMTIISGHQRYKACKDLGIELVPVIIKENLTNEDEKLKKLLATNFGRLKNNPVKQGKVFAEYEKLCGVRQGSAYKKAGGKNYPQLTQEDIAKELGISVSMIKKLKQLQTLSPELQQLIEDGSVKYTTALNVYAKLSPSEQSQLIEELGKDKITEMTQKQTEEYLKEKQILEQSYNELSQKYTKQLNKTIEPIETIVDNTDYATIDRLNEKIKNISREKDNIKTRLDLMENKAEAYKQDSLEYKKMKDDITYLTSQKDDLGRQLQAITDISGLVVEIDHLIKEKLAPVRYSKSLLEAKDDEIVMRNLTEIVETVEQWCYEMKKNIPNKIDYVEVI